METQLMLALSESLLWKQSLRGILEEVYCFWWCSSCCHFVMAVSALWFCYCIILFFLFIVFKVTMLVLGLFYLLVLSIWLFIYIVTLRLLSTRLLNAALSLKSQSMWNRISLRKAERRRKESGLPIHYYFFFDFVWTWIDGVFFFQSFFFGSGCSSVFLKDVIERKGKGKFILTKYLSTVGMCVCVCV